MLSTVRHRISYRAHVSLAIMLKNPNYVYGTRDLNVPSHLNFGAFILDRMWRFRDSISMIDGETNERLTYGEIVQQAMNFAVSLSRLGVGKGQTVALFSENRMEYWGAAVGVVCTGAVLTTVNTGYTAGEIKHITNIANPTIFICSQLAYNKNEKLLKSLKCVKKIIILGNERPQNSLSYNDLAINVPNNVNFDEFVPADVVGQNETIFILYSSGTTGMPKGVMLTHLNVISACCLPASHDPSVLTLTITPWYHVMGLVGVFTGLAVGRPGVFLKKFTVDLYLRTIEKYKVSQLTVVPPVLVAVCKSDDQYDLSSVKMIYSGAAPLYGDTIRDVHKKFPQVRAVFQGYGATEVTLAAMRFSFEDLDILVDGSVGKVVAGAIVKIVDTETRQVLGPNAQGEICIKGQLVMKGYVGKPRGEDFDDEDFYRTGDVGYYDSEKRFFITDRLKDLIKYKGYQVPPAELEAVLLQHEGVRDVGVVGIRHKDAGEVPLAFVVKQTGRAVTKGELKAFVAERLSNPKHLRGGVRFVDQIPKSPSGKILRKDLKKIFLQERSKL